MRIKLFSFLGTGHYEPAYYTFKTETINFITKDTTSYSQKAIYSLIKHFHEADETVESIDLFLALTAYAKETNYINNA